MLTVGINENVVLKSAVINDKKRLELEFIEVEKIGVAKKSVFDTLLTARTAEEGNGLTMKLNILGPLLPKKEELTAEKKIDMLGGDLTRLIKQLSQILEQYLTADKIDLDSMDVQFANTGITDSATFESRILDQDVLDRIYDNITRRFVELVTPFVNTSENAIRLKLIRQSKDKHYATLPSRFIADNPFIELMSVPKEQSRLKFTKYELEQGLDNGTPTSSAAAEDKTAAAPAVQEANPFAAQS